MADSNSVVGTAQPLQSSVSGWVNNREQMDFAYREEQRKMGELARLAKEREQAQRDARLKKYGDLKQAVPTGIGSIDQALAIYADQAMDKALELYKKEAAGQQLTPQEQMLYKKIETLPDTLALMTKAYTTDRDLYNEGVKSGKIKRDLDYELKLQRMPQNAIAFLDDDLNPVLGMDNDNDGQPDIISFDMNGLSLKPGFVENVNMEDAIKKVTDNLATTRTVTDSNFTKMTTEAIPLSLAQSTARAMVYNPDGSLTPLTKSYFYDAGIRTADQVTPEQLDSFEKFLAGRIVNSKGQIKETDVDYGARTAASRENRLASGDGDKRYTIQDLNHSTDTSNIYTQSGKQKGKEVIANNFTGPINIIRKAGGQSETFRSFGRDKDGNVLVTVDIGKPKYTAAEITRMTENIMDPDEQQARIDELASEMGSITTRTYSSKDKAGDVMYYVNRFDDPDTNQPYKTIKEFRADLQNIDTNVKPTAEELIAKYRPK